MSGASSVVGQNGIVVSRRRGKDTRQNAAIVNSLPGVDLKGGSQLIPFRCWSQHLVVLYFLPRVPRRDAAAGCSPRPWVAITSPLGRRGPRVASVPSIWSERSTHYGAQSAVGRAKNASIRIGERYTTRSTSVFRAAREG